MSDYCKQCLKYEKCDNSNCCDKAYQQGKADGIDEFKKKSYDIIEEIILNSNLEINQQLTIYAQIMVRIDRLEEQMKEQENGK